MGSHDSFIDLSMGYVLIVSFPTFGNKVQKHSVFRPHFYYAAVLHFFTTTIIINKTELHIDYSYNCIT